MKKEDNPVVVEQTFNVSAGTLWKSITEIDQMHQWYFDNIPDFKPIVGFETKFNVQSGNRNFFHIWKIIEVEIGKKIVYNWKYDGYAGNSNVIFEIFKKNKSTLLRLSMEILESFPQDIPEFKRDSCIGGWKYFIQQSLKEYLNKTN